MSNLFSAFLLASAAFIADAAAAPARVLETGDRIAIADGETFTVAELRAALRAYGYSRFELGDHFGRIIKITAYGPDKKRYRLRVRSTTGEVTDARRITTVF